MLYTNLKHIESVEEYERIISENEYTMIICGGMGPLCILVYRIVEELGKEYPHVKFFDMEYENPEAQVIRNLSEVHGSMEIPFIIYYKNGKVVKATCGIQYKTHITNILDSIFTETSMDITKQIQKSKL